jgi:hypothetical protein
MSAQDLLLKKRTTVSRNDERSGSVASKHTVTITNGTSLSTVAHVGEETLVGIILPAGWDVAALTFQVSNDNVTFYNLYDKDAEVTVTSAAGSRSVALDPVKTFPYPYLKIRSGTSGTPVNQTADRSIILLSKPV